MIQSADEWEKYGRYDEAARLREQVLAVRQERLEPTHLDVIDSLARLAKTRCNQFRFVEAEILQRELVERRRKLHGAGHQGTLDDIEALVNVLMALGRKVEGEEMRQEVLRLRTELRAAKRSTMSGATIKQQQYEEGAKLDREVLRKRTETLGPHHPSSLDAMAALARSLRRLDRNEEAEELGVRLSGLQENIE